MQPGETVLQVIQRRRSSPSSTCPLGLLGCPHRGVLSYLKSMAAAVIPCAVLTGAALLLIHRRGSRVKQDARLRPGNPHRRAAGTI